MNKLAATFFILLSTNSKTMHNQNIQYIKELIEDAHILITRPQANLPLAWKCLKKAYNHPLIDVDTKLDVSNSLGYLLMHAKEDKIELAEKLFEQAYTRSQKQQTKADAAYNLGYMYESLENYKDAEEFYCKAQELDTCPEDKALTTYRLARVLEELGKTEKAKENFTYATKQNFDLIVKNKSIEALRKLEAANEEFEVIDNPADKVM